MVKRNLILKCKKCGNNKIKEIPKNRPGYYLTNEDTIIGPIRHLISIKRFKKFYQPSNEKELKIVQVDEKGNIKNI